MDLNDKDSLRTLLSSSSSTPYHFLSAQERAYMNLIQQQIQPYFPKFPAALAEQSPLEREQGRCAVIDFSEPQRHQIFSFKAAAELDQYLGDPSPPPPLPHAPNGRPMRRLFMLEDLPCNHILTLGARLRIPPSFFAGHWDDPASSSVNHRNPLQRCSLPFFRLRYATSNRVEIDGPTSGNSNVFAFDTKARRYLHTYNRNDLVYDEARSHHAMSFWSSPVREDGSWDAVLLVDPAPGEYVRCLTSQALVPLRAGLADETSMPKHFLNPELDVLGELPHDCSQWAATYTLPGHTSMFDNTMEVLRSGNFQVDADLGPLSVVEIPRRLVISTLIAFIRRRYVNLLGIQKSEFHPYAMRHNYLSGFSKCSYSNWSGDLFDFIVGSRAAMKEFAREVDDNVVALGLDTTNSLAPQWERDGWQSIQDLTRVVEETVDAFATGYLQYVTIQEARVSNGNAQSLSRITVLTMLFIPLSTVASIFSMGGDFLPGEARAWVFWVVAIPILAMLVYLYWYKVIGRIWQRRKQQLLPLFEKTSTNT